MADQSSIQEILDFAIIEEEAAAAFYNEMAGKVDKAWMKKVFEGFAKEELGHKAKLLAIKANTKTLIAAEADILDIKLADYLVEADTDDPEKLDYQSALIMAMKKEKAAFRLYTDLAALTKDAALKETMLALAQEEAKHKLRFEVEYDDMVLTDN